MNRTMNHFFVANLLLTVGCLSPEEGVEGTDGAGGKGDNSCSSMNGGCPEETDGQLTTVVVSNEVSVRDVDLVAATRAVMRTGWSQFPACGFGGVPVIGATAAGELVIDGLELTTPTTTTAVQIQQQCLGGLPLVIDNQPGPMGATSVRAAFDLLAMHDETGLSIEQVGLSSHDPMFDSFAAQLGATPDDWRDVIRDEQLIERLLSETGVFSAQERTIVRIEHHKQAFTDGRPPRCGQVTFRMQLFDLPSLHVSDAWLRLDALDTHEEERIGIDCAAFGIH